MKYDFNKCTKEQFVKFVHSYYDSSEGSFSRMMNAKEEMEKTAEVKLRTRAEVDADIAKIVRDYHAKLGNGNCTAYVSFELRENCADKMNKLVAEETQG